jgi:chromosome segregation ATPase
MATTIGKTHCVTCGKDKVAYKCEACSQTFCVNHLADHHRELGLQLDEVEHKRNLFRQTLTEQTTNPQLHSLIQQVNKWEKDSINIIQRTADDARQVLAKHATENMNEIEIKLVELTKQLEITRQENDFNELHLNQFKRKLKQLEEQLKQPSSISIRQESSSFVGRINVVMSSGKCSMQTD